MNIDNAILFGSPQKHNEVFIHKGKKLQGIVCAIIGHSYGHQEKHHPDPEKRKIGIVCKRCQQKIVVSIAPMAKFDGIDHLINTGFTKAIHD
jgi:hypothetical protein